MRAGGIGAPCLPPRWIGAAEAGYGGPRLGASTDGNALSMPGAAVVTGPIV